MAAEQSGTRGLANDASTAMVARGVLKPGGANRQTPLSAAMPCIRCSDVLGKRQCGLTSVCVLEVRVEADDVRVPQAGMDFHLPPQLMYHASFLRARTPAVTALFKNKFTLCLWQSERT